MRPLAERLCGLAELALLRAASLPIPRGQRGEWWREWHGEYCHVREVCAARRQVLGFCLGAFEDARCVRKLSHPQRLHFPAAQRSPFVCLLALAAILIASYAAARLLPSVRAERTLAPAPIGPGLVLIQDADSPTTAEPTIASFQYRAWKRGRQQYFDAFAFYHVESEIMTPGAASARGESLWRVAHATPNLFDQLGLPIRLAIAASASDAAGPELILSEAGWKNRFAADPRVIGRIVRIGARTARIAGVAPDGLWALPGHADAWLLDPEAETAHGVLGYAVAHLTPAGRAMMAAPRIAITAYKTAYSTDDLLGVSLNSGNPEPWSVFLLASFVALLSLPAITPVELTGYSLHAHSVTWPRQLYRLGFFAAKIVLLWPIAYFVSLDLAYGRPLPLVTTQTYIQLASAFLICLFGLRWALRDQYRRCPVCLRLVAHPARVGLASSTFFAWNGTELICTGGHTLLHIPALPMSWFSAPRWLFREQTWELLMGGSMRE